MIKCTFFSCALLEMSHWWHNSSVHLQKYNYGLNRNRKKLIMTEERSHFLTKQRDQEFGKCCTNQSKVMRLLTAEIKKGK